MKDFPKLSSLNKYQEFIIKSQYPKFHQYLVNTYPDIKWIEKLYRYYYDVTETPVCKVCGSPVKFININDGYRTYCCRACSFKDPDWMNRKNGTVIKKYGSNSPFSSESVKDKIKQTNLERYGVENPLQSKKVREKIKQTNLERYGVENPFSSESVKDKIKQTNLERYGVNYPAQSESILNKIKQTNLERYGVENASMCESIKEKKIKTSLKNYMDIYDTITCKYPYPSYDLCEEKTYLEDFIIKILKEYNIEYIQRDRNVISPKELDIYIPSKKIAIECNGIYWHSYPNKEPNFHIKKFQQCLDQGIQLISIWEDWVKTKPEIVKSIILSKLGIYSRIIYARKCNIVEVPSDICSKFLDENHIQGKTTSKYKYGLEYDGELLAVMTFGKQNKLSCVKNNDGEWSLLRFCSKRGISIIGGASKLFKYFVKKHNPSKLYSYSSNDISNGSLYKKMGFKTIKNISPSYWYVGKNDFKRYHRTSFSKHRLREIGYLVEGKTESEIMSKLPYFKIYDSGHVRYEMEFL